ncbi:ABC transporter ATP-binding protein [Robertmurraya kyonggiensis]|uniref:ABC transporter ATP-binding protein n=1 Tax=Robertmurraya kyonggiensis TaxID=1037680 RepID=A0A4U1DAP8_9BACI|nr:ABC transporter ATP-binding protein [Robertmurraya kyonggiensis]TKC19113.1 ABC transporter ATP-binding protein [Robertmurraya kyonggiensis]
MNNTKTKRLYYYIKEYYLRKELLNMVLIILFTIILAVIVPLIPFITGKLVDNIIAKNSGFLLILVNLCTLQYSSFLLERVIQAIESISMVRVSNRIRKDFYNKIILGDYLKIKSYSDAELLERGVGDIEEIQRITFSVIPKFLQQFISGIIAFVLIYNIYPLFSILSTFIYLLALIPVRKFGNHQKSVSLERRNVDVKIKDIFLDSLRVISLIKSYGKEESHYQTFKNKNNMWSSISTKYYLANNFYRTFVRIIDALAPAIILIFGGYQVFIGNLTIGMIVTAIGLIPTISLPISTMVNTYLELKSFSFKIKKIIETLEFPDEINRECSFKKIKGISGNIVFKNISFTVNNMQILKNVSFNIREAEHVAIVGKSGSGKSTILKLLTGLISPTEGEIYFGDVNIQNIDLDILRENVVYVQHGIYIEANTIRQNLVQNKNINDELIFEISNATGFHNDINKFENYLDSKLESNGGNLSGGQLKKLGITRGLLSKGDIFFLDEITTGLDEKSRDKVFSAIRRYLKGKTCIFITHDIELAKQLDRIIEIENGSITYSKETKYVSNRELMNGV